jgi:hypothetical protein
VIASYDADEKDQLDALMREGLDRVAVARFNVGGRDVMDFIDLRHAGPWHVSGERIRDLNGSLLGPVVIVARRHDLVSSERA